MMEFNTVLVISKLPPYFSRFISTDKRSNCGA